MSSERQLGLLWGGVATMLVTLSPLAGRLASALPACPIKTASGLPCLTCGVTRAGVALSRLDLLSALSINPLVTVAWVVLVVGGLVAGVLAAVGKPIREPDWRFSLRTRWLVAVLLLANWAYLLGAGT